MHHSLGSDMDLRSAATVAVKADDLPCFLYANDNVKLPYHYPMALAAKNGAVSILRYGLDHYREHVWVLSTLYSASLSGNVECVDLCLRAFGTYVPLTSVLSTSASRGHLHAVRYFHARGASGIPYGIGCI
jgi:hypothetical protein